MAARPTHIVVQLDEDLRTDDYNDLLTVASRFDRLATLKAILTALAAETVDGQLPTPRMVTTCTVAELRALEAEAEDSGWGLSTSLTRYWRIDLSRLNRTPDEMENLTNEILDAEGVTAAYVELPVTVVGVDSNDDSPPGDNPQIMPRVVAPRRPTLSPSQTITITRSAQSYLNASLHGINAEWAWQQGGGTGEWTNDSQVGRVKLLDIEAGWNLRHEALRNLKGLKPMIGVNKYEAAHGTAVLGIVAGELVRKNGVSGICPQARVLIASHFHRGDKVYAGTTEEPTEPHVVDALIAARRVMRCGDVVLLEVAKQEGGWGGSLYHRPIEREYAVQQTLRLLASAGIVVIEAAGNANKDLDTLVADVPKGLADVRRGGYDSGAILVGGAVSTLKTNQTGHRRWIDDPGKSVTIGSNYGSRVDCYAWADRAWTSYSSSNTGYGNFGGTSAASAIIAGAATLAQSMRLTDRGRPFTPLVLRALFSDARHGTSALPDVSTANAPSDQIGVMPDLERVMDAAQQIFP
ncbi:MAG: S8 family serine peptidase [Micropruina sp.]|uniref:S8 family serine peptidase n=1 Tax=Micropruina sp. TaxID=2737536 RepID=UPI0039E2E75F